MNQDKTPHPQCEVSLVKSVQDKMAQLLIRAPYLTDKEEQDVLYRYIDLLRTRSEEMIIFIQVMLKVKQELAYARLDLERAIHSKDEVNEARKRVGWLTDRLKNLSKMCHNFFYDLQKEISKALNSEDTSSCSQVVEDALNSCVCGVMKKSIEDQTLDDVQLSIRKVLEASSDVPNFRPGSNTSLKKIDRGSKHSNKYTSSVSCIPQDGHDEDEDEDQSSNSEKVLNPSSWHSLALPGSDRLLEKNEELPLIGLPRKKKSKLNSIINYQNEALDQLLNRLTHLYTSMDETGAAKTENKSDEEALSKELKDSKIKTSAGITLPELSDKHCSDLSKPPSSLKDYPSNDDIIPLTLIPCEKSENLNQKKKTVFPRSPSIWCDYVPSQSPTLMDTEESPKPTLRRVKVIPDLPKENVGPPVKIEKSAVMKRAVARVKAVTKIKMLTSSSDSAMVQAKEERIKSLLGNAGIQSGNKNIAVDAAKALGQLKCHNEAVHKGLLSVINQDKWRLLIYECAKSMILLGLWHESAMSVITHHLKYGNKKVQEDVLLAIKKSHNAQFIPKSSGMLLSLSNALEGLLDDYDRNIAFNAALSLGHLCINKERAKWLLLDCLQNSTFNIKYEALNVLVKQMNCQNNDVIDALLFQLSNANCLKHRMKAVELLRNIGLKRLNRYGLRKVFDVLQQLLWNHPNKDLRSQIVAGLAEFGMRKEACVNTLRRLGDKDEAVRAESIIALATLEMKGEKELKMLLDILDLDSSIYVRTRVIKAFVDLKWDHPHIMRALEDRQKVDDALAQKAQKAFNFLSTLNS